MKSAKIILIAFSLTSGISCQITEPEPIVGKSTGQPIFAEIQFGNLDSGRTYVASVSVSIPDSLGSTSFQRMDLFFDTLRIASFVNPGQTIVINLLPYAAGEHVLSLVVYRQGGIGGMLSLLGAPDEIYSAPILVDNSPPSPVQGLAVQWDTFPTVIWSASSDANFFGYIIRKHNGATVTYLDTIFNRTSTSFVDSTVLKWHGNGSNYSIGTWNSIEVTYTATVSGVYGIPFPVPDAVVAVGNPVLNEIYGLTASGDLYAVSTVTNQTLRTEPVGGFANSPSTTMSVSADGVNLFKFWIDLGDTSVSVRAYQTATFDLVAEWAVPFKLHIPWSMAGGAGNDVYLVDTTGRVMRLNGLTGAVTDSTAQIAAADELVLWSTPDRGHLLLLERGYVGGSPSSRLVRIDIGGGGMAVMQSRVFNSFVKTAVADLAFSMVAIYATEPDGIEILDPGSFATTVNIPQNQFNPTVGTDAFVVVDGVCYVSFMAEFNHSLVVGIGIQSKVIERSWDFLGFPPALHSTRNGEFLYAFGISIFGVLSNWIIPL